MQIPMNTLCYLIKLVSLFPSYIIYSPFVASSIFAALSNFCRIIKLLPSWGFELFFIGVYISLMISQDIPSCETFSRVGILEEACCVVKPRFGMVPLFPGSPMSILSAWHGWPTWKHGMSLCVVTTRKLRDQGTDHTFKWIVVASNFALEKLHLIIYSFD